MSEAEKSFRADLFWSTPCIRFKFHGYSSFDSYGSRKNYFPSTHKKKSFSQQTKMIPRTINVFNSKIIKKMGQNNKPTNESTYKLSVYYYKRLLCSITYALLFTSPNKQLDWIDRKLSEPSLPLLVILYVYNWYVIYYIHINLCVMKSVSGFFFPHNEMASFFWSLILGPSIISYFGLEIYR